MAGDWIKLEHATLEKPEVMLLAELLGIKRDEAIGILCRFWVWLDRNTGNGFVTHVSRIGIDDVMHCPGFAAALEAVGWCKLDDSARTVAMPNPERHNGNPAKTRALGKARTAKSRNASVTVDALPEKRREESKSKRESIDTPTAEHREIASKLAIDCDVEWLKYRDQQVNAPRKHSDLGAGFRNWLRRASEFRPPPRWAKAASVHDTRQDTADQMHRRGKYARPDTAPADLDITAESERLA